MSLKNHVREGINVALRPFDAQIVRGRSTDPSVISFIPAKATIANAAKEGLSVGDYIDLHNSKLGATAETVDAMLTISGVRSETGIVCEIGPGSGRYAEKVIDALHPRSYEIYEPAEDWLPHLSKLPNVLTRPCDGRTLSPTKTDSVDLVHAHKVFSYLPLVVTAGYLAEMARVARPGGTIAFDILTEDCIDEEGMENWLTPSTFYVAMPRQWAIDFLARRNVSFVGRTLIPMSLGRTELMVFTKG